MLKADDTDTTTTGPILEGANDLAQRLEEIRTDGVPAHQRFTARCQNESTLSDKRRQQSVSSASSKLF